MKLIIALFIAALVVINAPANTNIHNSTTQDTKVQAVSAKDSREEPTDSVSYKSGIEFQDKAQTYQPVVVEPEPVAKVETPAPQVTPATGCEKYRDIIDNYSWNVDVAIAVCNAESSGNATTSNLNDYHEFANCRGSFGLFQINCSHGVVHDPVENIRIAAAMYNASGWKPWSFTTCRYKVACY
jgi:hypothetical protein